MHDIGGACRKVESHPKGELGTGNIFFKQPPKIRSASLGNDAEGPTELVNQFSSTPTYSVAMH
jgi:hypothetical protein